MSDKRELADEVVKYIQSGMSDTSLSEKFKLSFEELQQTLATLVDTGVLEPVDSKFFEPPKRRIKARLVVQDIRSGMTRNELLGKYELSPRMLQQTLRKLVDAKWLRPSDLRGDLYYQYCAEVPEHVREQVRFCLDFELEMYEKDRPEIRGRIIDIAEGGVGVIGMPAKVREIRTFVIYHEDFFEIDAFSFEAECRWVKGDRNGPEYVSGHRITAISEKDLEELRKLIHLLTM